MLEMLKGLVENASYDEYPIGPSMAEVVMRQLGEFREERAEGHLSWVAENLDGILGDAASVALAQVRIARVQVGGETLASRVYEYYGHKIEVTRTSPDSATVNLTCGMHNHEDFIVGKIEGHTGWGVGRKASGSSIDGSFAKAVDHCADRLLEECDSMESIALVDEFFLPST